MIVDTTTKKKMCYFGMLFCYPGGAWLLCSVPLKSYRVLQYSRVLTRIQDRRYGTIMYHFLPFCLGDSASSGQLFDFFFYTDVSARRGIFSSFSKAFFFSFSFLFDEIPPPFPPFTFETHFIFFERCVCPSFSGYFFSSSPPPAPLASFLSQHFFFHPSFPVFFFFLPHFFFFVLFTPVPLSISSRFVCPSVFKVVLFAILQPYAHQKHHPHVDSIPF